MEEKARAGVLRSSSIPIVYMPEKSGIFLLRKEVLIP